MPELSQDQFGGLTKGGTPQLFDAKPYMTTQARYPRGYTPERMRAVTSAIPWVPQNSAQRRKAVNQEAWTSVSGRRADAGETVMRQHQALGTIARSTVPVSHLEGLRHLAVDPQKRDSAGTYHGRREGVPPQITLAAGSEQRATVIHEIGHHVSAEVEGFDHSHYEHPEEQGQEEGYAENYADTHFRDRRGQSIAEHVGSPRKKWAQAASRRAINDGSAWVKGGERGGYTGGFREAFMEERQHSPLVKASAAHRAALIAKASRPGSGGQQQTLF